MDHSSNGPFSMFIWAVFCTCSQVFMDLHFASCTKSMSMHGAFRENYKWTGIISEVPFVYTLAKRSDTHAKDPTVPIRVRWITEKPKQLHALWKCQPSKRWRWTLNSGRRKGRWGVCVWGGDNEEDEGGGGGEGGGGRKRRRRRRRQRKEVEEEEEEGGGGGGGRSRKRRRQRRCKTYPMRATTQSKCGENCTEASSRASTQLSGAPPTLKHPNTTTLEGTAKTQLIYSVLFIIRA